MESNLPNYKFTSLNVILIQKPPSQKHQINIQPNNYGLANLKHKINHLMEIYE